MKGVRIPRTKDNILDELEESDFFPTSYQDHVLKLLLEVLIDIRENLEIPYIEETTL